MKKSMFSNHVSRRDLFLYGGQKGQKTEKSSFQQYSSQSQGEFSQFQDGFNSSCGSSELSQGRKMLDSYNTPQSASNKVLGSLMKPACSVPTGQGRPKFQQQFQSNRHKAKENEERELLQTISQSIRECSEEVQNVVKVFPEQLGDHMQMFGDSLTKIVNESLREQMENIILTFQEQRGTQQKIHEMKGIIDEKEARITELQKQLEHQRKTESQQSVTQVTEVLHRNKESMEKQLRDLMDSNQTITENQHRMMEEQDHQRHSSHQLHTELNRKLESIPTQFMHNSRFAEEIKSIRRDLEIQKREAFEFFQDSLSKYNDEQTREITRHFENELGRSANTICNTSNSVANIQRDHLQNTLKQQQEELKECIRSHFVKSKVINSSEESPQFVLQKQTDYSKVITDRKSRAESQLVDRKSPTNSVLYHKKSRQIHHEDSQVENFLGNPLGDDRNEPARKIRSIQQDFMSPRENRYPEQSKTFFQRPNPSPVATVLPQPQGVVQPRVTKAVQREVRPSSREQKPRNPRRKNSETRNVIPRRSQRLAGSTQESQNSSQDDYVNSSYASHSYEKSQPQSSHSSSNESCEIVPSYPKKPRHDRSISENLACHSKTFTHSPPNQIPMQSAFAYRNSNPSVRAPSKKNGKDADVFQFSDENSSSFSTSRQKLSTSSLTRKHENEVEDDTEESRESSPSVSITKIMIKRKSRKDSPASSVFSNFKTYSRPKTGQACPSTPGYQQSENGWKVNRGEVLFQRQASYKRKLMQVDDDLLELSHRIQNQLKRRC